jgi:hypothetical protein
MDGRRIVAMGGGGFSMEPDNPLLEDHVLSLARTLHPAVCFVPTASGDDQGYVARFYRAFAPRNCRPSDVQLFFRTIGDLEAFVLAQDVIYVGGGSTANMLAVWRVHGLDRILRRAWEDGEEQRRPVFTTLVAAAELADGWGADDGAALVFAGTQLEEVVASRPHASAVRVERTAGGGIDERRLEARYLGG